jgi:uncharacterized protein YbcI
MSAGRIPLTGDLMLAAVSAAIVALHERYHHRRPLSARTQLLGGDVLVCVLGGVYTDVEKTLIELQRATVVRESRSEFQTAIRHKFVAAVEELCGRDVVAFISGNHVGPDLEVEVFVLAPGSVVLRP